MIVVKPKKGTIAYPPTGVQSGLPQGIGFTVDLTIFVIFFGLLGVLSLLIYVGERSGRKT